MDIFINAFIKRANKDSRYFLIIPLSSQFIVSEEFLLISKIDSPVVGIGLFYNNYPAINRSLSLFTETELQHCIN